MPWEPFDFSGGSSLILPDLTGLFNLTMRVAVTVIAIVQQNRLLIIMLTLMICAALIMGLYKKFHKSADPSGPTESDYEAEVK